MIVTELDQTEDVNYNTRKDKSKAEIETDLFIREPGAPTFTAWNKSLHGPSKE